MSSVSIPGHMVEKASVAAAADVAACQDDESITLSLFVCCASRRHRRLALLHLACLLLLSLSYSPPLCLAVCLSKAFRLRLFNTLCCGAAAASAAAAVAAL